MSYVRKPVRTYSSPDIHNRSQTRYLSGAWVNVSGTTRSSTHPSPARRRPPPVQLCAANFSPAENIDTLSSCSVAASVTAPSQYQRPAIHVDDLIPADGPSAHAGSDQVDDGGPDFSVEDGMIFMQTRRHHPALHTVPKRIADSLQPSIVPTPVSESVILDNHDPNWIDQGSSIDLDLAMTTDLISETDTDAGTTFLESPRSGVEGSRSEPPELVVAIQRLSTSQDFTDTHPFDVSTSMARSSCVCISPKPRPKIRIQASHLSESNHTARYKRGVGSPSAESSSPLEEFRERCREAIGRFKRVCSFKWRF